MNASSQFFTDVQQHLSDMNQSATVTQDERDIIDDYAAQEFGAKECADQIIKQRD